MPRRPCYWTRKLELDLVEFIRERDYVWKYCGNTNHHIQQKYKAFAEFAAKLGRGFTARSVRDRWVNIRSTFNHNLRRVDKSKQAAHNSSQVYVPCWPLWKPLQFLRGVAGKDGVNYAVTGYESGQLEYRENGQCTDQVAVKEELHSELDDGEVLQIRQRGQPGDRNERKTKLKMRLSEQRTDRPRRRILKSKDKEICSKVIDDLVQAMQPLVSEVNEDQNYKFLGKHVAERLECMRETDAECASRAIVNLLDEWRKAQPGVEKSKGG